ncbi:MAG: AAA family ATPase [Nanoarchaeota archaeon]|nr:AAA family ATPase [Nanoarchaeota archaeon]
MIKKITVLDAHYSGLEQYFPQGLELNTEANVILLVGPNGSGKTAFMKMLATSIDFERYPETKNLQKYLKLDSSVSPLYWQEFVLPFNKETQRQLELGLERYMHFNPHYHGNKIVNPYDQYRPETKRRLEEMGFLPPKPSRYRSSPGQDLLDKINASFVQIERFFLEGINPLWEQEDHSPEGRIKRIFSLGQYKEKVEKVQDNAGLILFIDEPTIYLDYKNKMYFVRKIQQLSEKYSSRLQFFIATNDLALIEKSPGCLFINLYTQPAQCTTILSLEAPDTKLID